MVNGRFDLPGPAGTKVVAFGETGIPFAPNAPVVTLSSGQLAGGIPGWTFTGGDGGVGEELCAGLGCTTFGDGLPGDSGTEGGGNPGNELILSTIDGKTYQTSTFSLPAAPLPATQKVLLTFDVHNIFTPTGMSQLTAWLYYVDLGGIRQTIGSPLVVGPLADFQTSTLEFVGGSAALTPALGRPIGVSFDTTSRELDVTVTESWAGVDNVLLEIAGTLAGDFNGDGSVTLADYTILNNNLEEAHDYLFEGDIVRDGFVDLNDFRAWKSLPSVISSGVLAQIAAIPEPSSMVLILVTAATAGAFSRRRLGTSSRLNGLLLAAIGGIAFFCSSASAAVLYYDPFLVGANPAAGEYTLGPIVPTLGNGQNPTVGPTPFFSEPWEMLSADVAGGTVQAQGLSFLGSPAAGGAVTSVPSSRPGRNMTTPFDATTVGTYYMSFLMSFGASPTGTAVADVAHRAVEMWSDVGTVGNDGDVVLRLGYMSFNGNFNNLPPSQAPLKFGPFGEEVIIQGGPASFLADNGATHLFVLKFTLSDQPLSDNIELFLDPNDNEEPVVADAAFFGRDFTLGSVSGPIQFGGTGTNAVFDELRVGTTYQDALPLFPRKGNTNPGTCPSCDDLVDILDYTAIIQHMNLTGQSTANGDVTGDGRVDLEDLRVWRDNRTDIPGLEGLADVTVPEPTSVALGLLASLGLLGLRRRGK